MIQKCVSPRLLLVSYYLGKSLYLFIYLIVSESLFISTFNVYNERVVQFSIFLYFYFVFL